MDRSGRRLRSSNVTRRSVIGTAMLAPLAAYAAPEAGGDKRPNFLFLFPDQLRFDWLENAALPVHTPNLDALVARGTRFAKAYSASPVCAPSRACLACGRNYDQCGVPSNGANYPLAQDTYYHRLQAAGYYVGACGKLDLNKADFDQGLDGRKHMADWGFSDMVNCGGKGDAVHGWQKTRTPHEPYMAYLLGLGGGIADAYAADIASRGGGHSSAPDAAQGYAKTDPSPLSDEAYEDNWIGRSGLGLLERFPKGQPWHLVVNFAGPHDPEDITARMEKTVRDRSFPQPNASTELDPGTHEKIRQNYTAMIENIDRWVGIYVDRLRQRGELENTIIVFSSDHGEMLGDHNRWGKNVPYDPSLCVPLIVAGPGVENRRSDALISLIDVGATFLDYAGAQPTDGMAARSFRPVLEGKADRHRDYVNSGLFHWRLVSDGRYKLVRGFDPKIRPLGGSVPKGSPITYVLYDLQSDPLESRNVADSAPDIVARLARYLPPVNTDPKYAMSGPRPG